MSEHIDRKNEIFKGAVPLKGTGAYKKLVKEQEKILENPAFKKHAKESFEKATKSVVVQNSNGIGLTMDQETRFFLREFNERLLEHGIRSMPLLFNVMEAFFNYDKSMLYFELLEEEDYLISFFDFLDFYTSNEFQGDIESIKENIQTDLIYNYNVGADIKEITFKTEEGLEFVIGGISMVRRNNEVTIVFLAGEMTDTSAMKDEDNEGGINYITPGKEDIANSRTYEKKPVRLNDTDGLWKTLIMCRFDLDSQTIDGRYVAKDYDAAYDINTDDLAGFLGNKESIPEEFKEAYQNKLKIIEAYNPLFELAKAVLHIPQYFNHFEVDILSENHQTNYRQLVINPIKRRGYNMVNDKFKVLARELYILNRHHKFAPDRVEIYDSNFKIEKTGYWKTLSPDEYGMDKKGQQITGKTWVNRQESYFEGKNEVLVVSNNKNKPFNGPNAGSIYVMRAPFLPENTFKIGLTTKTPEERADQLSKTSIPDRHYVMKQWETADCKQAEKKIHEILAKYRTDPRREFFYLDMETICETIQTVIDDVNKNA